MFSVSVPIRQDIVAGLGSSVSGSETGIYEIQGAVIVGMAAVILLVAAVCGAKVVSRLLWRAGFGSNDARIGQGDAKGLQMRFDRADRKVDRDYARGRL